MSPTDTKRRLFICFSRLGKTVTKMYFSKGRILWRFVITMFDKTWHWSNPNPVTKLFAGPSYSPVHHGIVWNRLHEAGIRVHQPYVGPSLIQARRMRRMAWLTAHTPRRVRIRQWRRSLFTKESRFTIFRPDGRHRVYRCRGERFADGRVVERNTFAGGSVMV